jgi:hypothetical protein
VGSSVPDLGGLAVLLSLRVADHGPRHTPQQAATGQVQPQIRTSSSSASQFASLSAASEPSTAAATVTEIAFADLRNTPSRKQPVTLTPPEAWGAARAANAMEQFRAEASYSHWQINRPTTWA